MISSDRFEVDAVDFQIACRRFTIKATISRDKQLPVVDEFVLRLLASLEQISVQRMRAWFGFSVAEMETVLIDMGRRGLVELNINDVALAPAGRDMFRKAGENGIPHVVEIAPLVSDVWFDLISRNMVPSSRARNVEYLVKLPELQSARDLPDAFAREAFEENFRDYARRIRRFPDPDAVNLYSISDVEGGTYGYQVMSAELVLDMQRMAVRPVFTRLGEGAPALQKLTVAANDAWQSASGPESASSVAAEFERMTGDNRLSSLFQQPTDPSQWISTLGKYEASHAHFKPTLGAIYLSQNIIKAIEIIGALETIESKVDLVWLRPSGSAWGRSLLLSEALSQIRQALRNVGRANLTTHLAMPRATNRTVRYSHKRVFDRGGLLPQGHLPANLEILLVPGILAFVNAHIPVGGHAVPIGGIVTGTPQLARIEDRLQTVLSDKWEKIWQPKKDDGADQTIN